MNAPTTTTASTLCDLVDHLARERDKSALVEITPQGPREHSRGDLYDQVSRLARGLGNQGLGSGDIIALLADNRREWVLAALAAIRCGACLLPIDTQLGDTQLKHILSDSGTRLVFANEEQAQRITALDLAPAPRLVRLDRDQGEDAWSSLLDGPENELPEAGEDDNAILFYTSGTTGPPKGVPLTHRNLLHQLREIEQVELVRPTDRLLLPLPLHHVYPLVIGLLAPLYLGLPVIQPRSLTGPDILRAIDEGRVNVIIGVPRLYRALYTGILSQIDKQGLLARSYIRAAWALSGWARRRFGLNPGKRLLAPLHRRFGPSLRLLASGGSALDPDLARRLEGLGWDIGIGYGLTETSPLLTLNLPGSGNAESVGRVLPGVDLRIAESGDDRPGEVQVRGPNVFQGYWQAPDKTRESFTEDGWYRTGDLGRLDEDGFLYLHGRASTLIVTESGKNIQPEEVEEQYAAHPWIGEAGVLEDQGKLVAVIIADPQAVRQSGLEEAEALRQAVSEQSRKLPSYQRLSDYVISREALPRTRLGKIQRHRLEERYRQAHDAENGAGAAQDGPIDFADMSDQDQGLLEDPNARKVWQWLARRYSDVRLTPDTSPALDLNIDSIEMINLTMEINQLTRIELDQQALARVDTVRDLLQEVVHQAEAGGGGGLDPERVLTEPEDYLSDEQRRWLRPLGPLLSLIPRLARPLLRGLMRLMFRLEVHGLDKLPRDRPFFLAPNHVSILDPAALFCALPWPLLKRTYFAGWTGMAFKNAPMRFIARMGQTVPIDPERAAASSLSLGATVLKQGCNLIWFPEGERSRDGRLKPFKPGIGLLLKHYPVTVIPVHIAGAHEAMPRGSSLPRRHPVTLTFGEPVQVEALIDETSDTEVQEQISRALYQRLKAMMDESDRERG